MSNCASSLAHGSEDQVALRAGLSGLSISHDCSRTLDVREVGPHAFELRARDENLGDDTVWTAVIRTVHDESGIHVLVENQMVSDDLSLLVSVGRPKVVHDGLSLAAKPLLGGSALLTSMLPIPSNGASLFIEVLSQTDRTLRVIVCSEPEGNHDGSWLR